MKPKTRNIYVNVNDLPRGDGEILLYLKRTEPINHCITLMVTFRFNNGLKYTVHHWCLVFISPRSLEPVGLKKNLSRSFKLSLILLFYVHFSFLLVFIRFKMTAGLQCFIKRLS